MKLKINQAEFAFMETIVNGITVFLSAVTPNTPVDLAAKGLAVICLNAGMVLVGVESGDIPEPPAAS